MRVGRIYAMLGACPGGAVVKIGYTTNVAKRLRAVSQGSPFPVSLLADCAGSLAQEKSIHALLDTGKRTTRGEWYPKSNPHVASLVAAIAIGAMDCWQRDARRRLVLDNRKPLVASPRPLHYAPEHSQIEAVIGSAATRREAERAARAAGCSRSHAKALASQLIRV